MKSYAIFLLPNIVNNMLTSRLFYVTSYKAKTIKAQSYGPKTTDAVSEDMVAGLPNQKKILGMAIPHTILKNIAPFYSVTRNLFRSNEKI